jgi:hypothetical protein
LILPIVKNNKDYKVEISFSKEGDVIECANASFSFNRKSLKEEYGIQPYRFLYYVIENKASEILETRDSNCKSE